MKRRAWENPLFVREATQRTRLLWTPLGLLATTVLLTLLIGTVGGLMLAARSRPAQIGIALFHTFFSVAFFVIIGAGATVAAHSVASERDGRTWEPLILTGITTREIARGKLASALSSIGTYIVMIAPVGALSFLFGGVTAVELALAYAWLAIFGVLSAAFGLALSSVMTVRGAVVVTLLLSFSLSPVLFGVGWGIGAFVSDVFKEVDPYPVWLPTAYDRVPFGISYVSWLVFVPLSSAGICFWYLYEAARANLADPNDDRSSGLRRWFLVSGTLLAVALASIVATAGGGPTGVRLSLVLVVAYFGFLGFSAFTFVGEPVVPSRRVLRLMKEPGGPQGLLAPGLVSAALMVMLIGGVGVTVLLVTLAFTVASSTTGPREVAAVGVVAANAVGFVAFLLGLGALLRARGATSFSTRLLLSVASFFAFVGPWVVMAVGWAATKALVVACPSPIFAVIAAAEFVSPLPPSSPTNIIAAAAVGAAWLALGGGLFGAAARRAALERTRARKAEWDLDQRMASAREADEARDEDPDAAPLASP